MEEKAGCFAPLMEAFNRKLIDFKKTLQQTSPFPQSEVAKEMEESVDCVLKVSNEIEDFLNFLTEEPVKINSKSEVDWDWEQMLEIPLGTKQKEIVEFFRGNNNCPTQIYPLFLEKGKWFGAGVFYLLNSQLKTAGCPVRIRQLPKGECKKGVIKYKFYSLLIT